MPEGVPPVPTSIPPKSKDDTKKEVGPAKIDPTSWSGDGKSPAEALAGTPAALRREGKEAVARMIDAHASVKSFAGKVTEDLRKGAKARSSQPNPLELPTPDAELALDAPHATSGTYAGHDGDFPVQIGETKIGPDGQEYVHVHSSDQGLDGFVPAGSVTKENLPTGPIVPGAEGLISLESFKNPEKKDFLKPAEVKRIWKNELKNAVGKVALTQENLAGGNAYEPVPNFAEFSRDAAVNTYAELSASESKYEDAYKSFYKNNNFVGRIFKRMRPLGAASLEIQHARNERDQMRLQAHENFMTAARARWTEQGKNQAWIDKAVGKYENIHLFKNIIAPGAERETQIRAEALGEKVPDQLEKGLRWVKNSNESFNTWIEEKLGEKNKKYAPVVRAIGTAVVLSGGAAFVGSVGTAGVLAALGVGGFSVMRALGGTAAGALVGGIIGSSYNRFIGQKAQQKAVVENVDLKEELRRLTQSKELTLELLQTIDKRRVQLQSRASDETLMQKTLILKTLVGLGVGMSTAAAISEWQGAGAVAKAAEQAGAGISDGTGSASDSAPTSPGGGDRLPAGVDSAGEPDGSGSIDSVPQQPAVVEGTGPESTPPASPDAATAPEAASTTPETNSLSISGNINNADRLIGHFGLELQDSYSGATDAPPAVQKLFELLSTDESASLLAGEDKATLALGLQTADGSAIMQPGDTISLNAENQIVLERPGAPELRTVLIEANGEVASSHNFPMDSVVEASAPEVPTQPAAPETPTAPVAPEAPVAPAAPAAPEVPAQPDVAPLQPAESTPYVPQEPVAEAPPASEPTAFPESAPVAPPAPEAPPVPEAPPAPEAIPGVAVNEYGLTVDSRIAQVYADASDNIIVHGGTLAERMELAQEFISQDHAAVVFLDSSTPDPITGLDVAHITRAFWDTTLNQIQMPNEAMDPSLQTYSLPTADDLARRVEMPQ